MPRSGMCVGLITRPPYVIMARRAKAEGEFYFYIELIGMYLICNFDKYILQKEMLW